MKKYTITYYSKSLTGSTEHITVECATMPEVREAAFAYADAYHLPYSQIFIMEEA